MNKLLVLNLALGIEDGFEVFNFSRFIFYECSIAEF